MSFEVEIHGINFDSSCIRTSTDCVICKYTFSEGFQERDLKEISVVNLIDSATELISFELFTCSQLTPRGTILKKLIVKQRNFSPFTETERWFGRHAFGENHNYGASHFGGFSSTFALLSLLSSYNFICTKFFLTLFSVTQTTDSSVLQKIFPSCEKSFVLT
jgi:hypothetical protein